MSKFLLFMLLCVAGFALGAAVTPWSEVLGAVLMLSGGAVGVLVLDLRR